MIDEIKTYLDSDNRVKIWPSKRSKKEKVLAYLATKFQHEKSYSEREVNELLNQWHTFTDAPLLRRELYEFRYLDRTKDCTEYWKII